MMKKLNEKGLTLLEVVLAMAIVGIIVISVLNSFNQSYKITEETHERSVAINLAKQQLELLKRFDDTGMVPILPTMKTVIDGGIVYQVKSEELIGGDFDNSNFTPVRATVTWSNRGKSYSISLETCYVKRY